MDQQELLWSRYKHDVDLHRTYLDLVIKINVFYYAITGAIISFYFLHIDNEPLVKYSLILPFLMNVGLSVFFFRSALASRHSQNEIKDIACQLEFKVYSVAAAVLEFLLWVFFVTLILVAIGLLILFFKDFNFCEVLGFSKI